MCLQFEIILTSGIRDLAKPQAEITGPVPGFQLLGSLGIIDKVVTKIQ